MIGLIVQLGVMYGMNYIAQRMVGTQQPKTADMAPVNPDAFSITRCQEGTVVPLIFGQVRIPGNVLWYGNFETEPVYQHIRVKRSFHRSRTESVIVGYNYYIDMWQSLALGPVSILRKYINGKPETGDDNYTMIQNNGEGTFYPDIPVPHVNHPRGVAHVFFKRFFMGENVTTPPTIHFVAGRTLITPVNHSNMGNGANPAAVVYELLIMGGATSENIDLDSFNRAADYWYGKGYGLNLCITGNNEVRQHIETVFQYVDGCLIDHGDLFELIAFTPDDQPVDTITTDDFTEFTFTRKSWNETLNDFRANYTDMNSGYSTRTVHAINAANIDIQGQRKQKTIDLTAFRDSDTASRRLWEIAKRLSYPEAEISFKTGLGFSGLLVGQVVTITHSGYGLSETEWRIIEKEYPDVDSNEVSFRAVQMTETLFDDTFLESGISDWQPLDLTPQPLLHQGIFEVPGNLTGHTPAFLLLAARSGTETGFRLLISTTGTDYSVSDLFTTFSQHGVLDETYPVTIAVDDDTGILYTPAREDPVFPSVNRADLFSGSRFAIIGDEMIGFQTVTPEGDTGIRLTGCIRGLYNTPISAHPAGSEIWIASLYDNITELPSPCYIKLVPYTSSQSVAYEDVTAIQVTSAPDVWGPSRITALKSGTTVTLTWWPKDDDPIGAGADNPDNQTDQYPFVYSGDFVVVHPGGVRFVDGCTATISGSGDFVVEVMARRNGMISSSSASVYVGTEDGEYTG